MTPNTQVGGGVKKILYALRTIQRIGLLDSRKALSANNACKACGLGMGGQAGGMTNELGEFPAVCNKSIQAQSTDIQPPIPDALFRYSLADFRALSAHELEHLGRLGTPIFKSRDATSFTPVTWSWAIEKAVNCLQRTTPNRTFFYSSGRSSNEAGFVFQLLARAYGTNNVNNCSYYCHQATSEGLSGALGTGTATVTLADLDRADCVFVIGANPASNHPRFIHKLKACRDRGGEVVVINPARESGLVKFALPKSPKSLLRGGDEIASHYVQPRIGSDASLLAGIAKQILDSDRTDTEFIATHTSGFHGLRAELAELAWPDIEAATGLAKVEIVKIADVYARSKHTIFAWGMGITHHAHGVENVEAIVNLCLLRGMLAREGAGLLPLRGHSNVQGVGTIGVKPTLDDQILDRVEAALNICLPSRQSETGLDTMACLEAADQGKMDAAVLLGGNLFSASPDTQWVTRAMNKIGTRICMTTTLNASHVQACDDSELLVLPVAARDEEPEPTTQESMFNFVRMSDGGIQRIANARSEVSVLADIGELLLPDLRFSTLRSHTSVREIIAESVPGMQALAEIDTHKREFHVEGRLRHTPTFSTSDQRAQFRPVKLSSAREAQSRPFTLMSVRSEGQFNSIIYEEHDSYRGTKQRWVVMISEHDAATLGLAHGDCADIASDNGVMEAVAVHLFDLPAGDVMAYYPEANILVGRDRDPRSKTPGFKSVAVSIKPHHKNR
ncbi:formate dehydrogenase [Arenicella chitinivorans]|uniref:Formate dehydrogenase n=1 Tax=Arenicella chitinivorans TaxID=1329800 RepID=A0A918S077_9GAMM|nr:FdhF/YdeP family oxidoreductase [Arenicella chitinivorans]GHA15461.1 formate dehydrogenase [Arenicella chitinivorans]